MVVSGNNTGGVAFSSSSGSCYPRIKHVNLLHVLQWQAWATWEFQGWGSSFILIKYWKKMKKVNHLHQWHMFLKCQDLQNLKRLCLADLFDIFPLVWLFLFWLCWVYCCVNFLWFQSVGVILQFQWRASHCSQLSCCRAISGHMS